MKTFLFILAMVSPQGEFSIFSQAVKQCPSQELIASVMDEKVKKGDIILWGGQCEPLPTITRI